MRIFEALSLFSISEIVGCCTVGKAVEAIQAPTHSMYATVHAHPATRAPTPAVSLPLLQPLLQSCVLFSILSCSLLVFPAVWMLAATETLGCRHNSRSSTSPHARSVCDRACPASRWCRSSDSDASSNHPTGGTPTERYITSSNAKGCRQWTTLYLSWSAYQEQSGQNDRKTSASSRLHF